MARKVKAAEDQNVHPEAAQQNHEWHWREPRDGEHFRRCSWDGSIHPEDLIQEADWRPAWADMKYGWPHKFYVDIANKAPQRLFVMGSTNSAEPPQWGGQTEWVHKDRLNAEQQAAVALDPQDWSDNITYILFGNRSHHQAKFYTAHLRDSNLSPETRDAIMKGSHVRIHWMLDGRVTWEPYIAVGES